MSIMYLGLALIFPIKFHPDPSTLTVVQSVFQDTLVDNVDNVVYSKVFSKILGFPLQLPPMSSDPVGI